MFAKHFEVHFAVKSALLLNLFCEISKIIFKSQIFKKLYVDKTLLVRF